MSNFCSAKTAFNGKSCNPPGGAPARDTGNCAGLPINNYVDLVILKSERNPDYVICDDYPQVPSLNNFRWPRHRSPVWYNFIDYDGDNLGVNSDSNVYQVRPKFRSCDRSRLGPRRVKARVYFSRFNGREPYFFKEMVDIDRLHLSDTKWTGT